MLSILTVAITYEQDVVLARQRTRQLAELLGFDSQQQTRLATAVSEIARNAYQYAGGGRVQFDVEGETAPQVLLIRVSDSGPGISNLKEILEGRYRSTTGMGAGIVGARGSWTASRSSPRRGVAPPSGCESSFRAMSDRSLRPVLNP